MLFQKRDTEACFYLRLYVLFLYRPWQPIKRVQKNPTEDEVSLWLTIDFDGICGYGVNPT